MGLYTQVLARALPMLLLTTSSYAQLSLNLTVDYSVPCQRSIIANVTGGTGNYVFNWGTTGGNACTTPPNNSSQRLDVPATYCSSGGTYTVFVRDRTTNQVTYNEIDVSRAVVGQFDILLNNFATPNGDGINDTFDISPNSGNGLLNAYSITVNIYNRWGARVHQTSFAKNDGGGLGGKIVLFNPVSYRGSTLFYEVDATNCDNGTRLYKGTLQVN